jgi:transglutaminase-like putative cysteine protease
MISNERKAEIMEEAEGIYYTIGWDAARGYTEEEAEFFWKYVHEELGYDSCNNCGTYVDFTTFDGNGYCDECADEEGDS